MKKTILTLTLIGLVFALLACSGTTADPAAANPSENGNANAANSTDGDQQFSMPTEMMLMLGTVKLDETEVAVDAEQASELLPLWKVLRSLSESETAAQVEIDALISQIEETMTPKQISTIEAMNLSMQDMAGVAETLGIEMGGLGGGFGEMTPEMQATMEAARESGEFPSGGPGGEFPGGMGPGSGQGPGGGFGGAEMDPAVRETAIAERGGARGAGFGVNSVLLEAIITFLETKIQ